VFRCAAFWVADQGLLTRGVEYWVTVAAEQPGPRLKDAPAYGQRFSGYAGVSDQCDS
jgi:hypothetical protein